MNAGLRVSDKKQQRPQEKMTASHNLCTKLEIIDSISPKSQIFLPHNSLIKFYNYCKFQNKCQTVFIMLQNLLKQL